MVPIAIGTGGFFLLLIADFAQARNAGALRFPALVASALSIGWGLVEVLDSPDRLPLPSAVRVAAGILAVPFLALLLWSLFLEIPFSPAYGGAAGPRTLVTTGTYALSRHPGVLWLFLLQLACATASASRLLLVATVPWTCANVILVAIEDRFLFPRIFGDAYRAYQRSVPFLVPTPPSIRRCVATFRFPWIGDAARRNRGNKG